MPHGDDWIPLSARDDGDLARFAGPVEGIPDWLSISVWDYIEPALGEVDRAELYGHVRRMERRLRTNLQIPRGSPGVIVDVLKKRMVSGLYLDVLDYLLQYVIDVQWADSIGAALLEGGSVWTVVTSGDHACLARRVQMETQARAQHAIEVRDRSGDHLAEAWRCIFGRGPDGQKGYDQVVKAVECAVLPVVCPENARATLGAAIADMRAKPSKWMVALNHPDPQHQVLTIADMMNLLWKGQHRHGVPDAGAPMGNTIGEAEAAIQIGITLVELFRDGQVRPAS